MANIQIKFRDRDYGHLNLEAITVEAITINEPYISILLYDEQREGQTIIGGVELTKSTAIKLSKTLRTEINKITEFERGGNNG